MTAVLSLGSNLGDRLARLREAVALLQPYAVSSVWQSAPWGGVEQPDFLNAIVLCELDATGAWELAQQAEQQAGRERAVRWGPRTLDVDVVLADAPVPGGLLVPHPRAYERAFVLAPWLEVEPAATLPGYGPVRALLAGLDDAGLTRRDDLALG
ncbi:MAG: 2-amino-4-hydroxy-6-hydroxymethyldihydropteridine diphosphokinase [Frankiales bacterium]|nr:2-amino-4-hydroxy-6-hydroxymethyldihydropteridine diphosphokinase [Frankiales bacterium]